MISNSVHSETVSWVAVGVELVMRTFKYFETRRERLVDAELSGRRFSTFSVFWGLSSAPVVLCCVCGSECGAEQ